MANFVPLFLDKTTGHIVAKPMDSTLFAGTTNACVFEQSIASTTWSIPHNKGTDKAIVQIYEDSGQFILSDNVTFVDLNNIEITFASPKTGTAHILFFGNTPC